MKPAELLKFKHVSYHFPVFGLKATDVEEEISRDDPSDIHAVFDLIKESGDYPKGPLFNYLRRNNGAIIIDPRNLLELRKNIGQVALVGAGNSSFQGLSISKYHNVSGEYEGQEGCPPEYTEVINEKLGFDPNRAYLFISVDPGLSRSFYKNDLKKVIKKELLSELILNEDEPDQIPDDEIGIDEAKLKRTKDIAAQISPRIPRPEIEYKVPKKPVLQPTKFQFDLSEKKKSPPPLQEYRILNADFKSVIPYYTVLETYIKRNENNPSDVSFSSSVAFLLHEKIKGTQLEKYLSLWKGAVLIDPHPNHLDYNNSCDLSLIGNNRKFYQNTLLENDWHSQLNNKSFDYVPTPLKVRLNRTLGYPEKHACLYVGIKPDFLDKDKKSFPKLVSQFMSSLYFTEEDMDIDAYLFGVKEYQRPSEYLPKYNDITKVNPKSPRFLNSQKEYSKLYLEEVISNKFTALVMSPVFDTDSDNGKKLKEYALNLDDYFHNVLKQEKVNQKLANPARKKQSMALGNGTKENDNQEDSSSYRTDDFTP